jgi:hypothetical protein
MKCGVCKDYIEEKPVICAKDESLYHDACWEYNEGCGVYGCSSSKTLETKFNNEELFFIPNEINQPSRLGTYLKATALGLLAGVSLTFAIIQNMPQKLYTVYQIDVNKDNIEDVCLTFTEENIYSGVIKEGVIERTRYIPIELNRFKINENSISLDDRILPITERFKANKQGLDLLFQNSKFVTEQ